jgi:2-phosphoglycolate phosphatase
MAAAVIFDLDGTLLDTEPDFSLLLNRQLEQHGRPPVSRTAVRHTVSSGARALIKLGFDLGDDDPKLQALLEEFLASYAEQITQTQACLFDDIDQLIASLHGSGTAWGIMTNKARRFSAPLIERFDTFASCGSLVCPDDVNAGKPDPAGILRACAELQVPPQQAIYVGDHPRDIEAARNAGMPGIAVRWGYLPQDSRIENWGADYIADTADALDAYIRTMNRHV